MTDSPSQTRLRADVPKAPKPVGYFSREDLAELQNCNGRSIWAEGPGIWSEHTPTPGEPVAPAHLVALYLKPSRDVQRMHDTLAMVAIGLRQGVIKAPKVEMLLSDGPKVVPMLHLIEAAMKEQA